MCRRPQKCPRRCPSAETQTENTAPLPHRNSLYGKAGAVYPVRAGYALTLDAFLLLVLVLAGLVCHAAAGLACRLAGSLALAASALLRGFAEITGLKGFDSLHGFLS